MRNYLNFRTVSVPVIRMCRFTLRMRFHLDYDDDRFRPLQCDRKGYRREANDNQWSSTPSIWYLGFLPSVDYCTSFRMGPVRDKFIDKKKDLLRLQNKLITLFDL